MQYYGLEGAPLSEMLDDINQFLNNNPNEFIMLHVRLVKGRTTFYPMLYDTIESTIPANRLLSQRLGIHFRLNDQLTSEARIIVVSNGEQPGKEWVWSQNQIIQPITSSHRGPTNTQEKLVTTLTEQVPNLQQGGLTLAHLYLSPEASDYSLDPTGVNSRSALNKTLRWPSGIARYTANALRGYNHTLNIVSQDFSNSASVYNFCMAEMKRPKVTRPSNTAPLSPSSGTSPGDETQEENDSLLGSDIDN